MMKSYKAHPAWLVIEGRTHGSQSRGTPNNTCDWRHQPLRESGWPAMVCRIDVSAWMFFSRM